MSVVFELSFLGDLIKFVLKDRESITNYGGSFGFVRYFFLRVVIILFV